MILNPEPLPSPGMAGGPKANTWAPFISFDSRALILVIITFAVSSRFEQFLRLTNINLLFSFTLLIKMQNALGFL